MKILLLILFINPAMSKVYAGGDKLTGFGATINYMGKDYIGISPNYFYSWDWRNLIGISGNIAYYRNLSGKPDIVSAGYKLQFYLVLNYGGSIYAKTEGDKKIGFTQTLGLGHFAFLDIGAMMRREFPKTYFGIYANIGLPFFYKEKNDKKYNFIY